MNYYFFVTHVSIFSTATPSKFWFGNLKCTDCNSTINRLHHRFFVEYYTKISCLKNNFLSRKPLMYQPFTTHSFTKLEFMSDLSEKALKSLMYLQENLDVVSFFSVMFQVYDVYIRFHGVIRVFSCNNIKNGFHHRGFPSWVLQDELFLKFRTIFCQMSLSVLCNKVSNLSSIVVVVAVVVAEYFL